MNGIEIYRRQMLSAPNIAFRIGDRVWARLGPLGHEFRARVVGRTIGQPIYDVEDETGTRHLGVRDVRLDEEAMREAAK